MSATDHTPAQRALRRTMEQISEEHWASGWTSGLERILWGWITTSGGPLSAEERDVLRWLSDVAVGWWHWPSGAAEPQFIGRREWMRLYQEGTPRTGTEQEGR